MHPSLPRSFFFKTFLLKSLYKNILEILGKFTFLKLGAHANFFGDNSKSMHLLSHSSGTKQGNAQGKRPQWPVGKFGSCAIRKAELVPIESDMHTPDDPDYDPALRYLQLETAPETTWTQNLTFRAIQKASMNIFYQFTTTRYGATIYWWLKELR